MIHNEDSRVKIPAILHLMRFELEDSDLKRISDEISLDLENEDLGRAFYEKLIDRKERQTQGSMNMEAEGKGEYGK